jgi:hypothetical protein
LERAAVAPANRIIGASRSKLAAVVVFVQAGAELRESRAVAAHAVAVSIDLHDGRVVREPVEDRDRDGRVLKDRPPFGDPAVGGQDHGAVEVAAADDLEQVPPAAMTQLLPLLPELPLLPVPGGGAGQLI